MAIKYDNSLSDKNAKGEVVQPQTDDEGILFDYEDDSEFEDVSEDENINEGDDDENLDDEGEYEEVATPQKVKSKQSPETDAAFAKMRRELETTQKALHEAEALAKSKGYNSLAEMQQKEREQERNAKIEQYKELGYDPEIINDIFKLNPEYQAFVEMKQRAEQEKVNQMLLNEFNQVKAEYPDLVNSPQDIPEAAWEKYKNGYDLLDAFESVNRNVLKNRNRDAIKQKTLNSLNSKSHLKTERDGGSTATDVPITQDVMQMYVEMGMSRKEAIAYHKKLYR